MTLKEAYDKIDNTLCLNSQRLEFNRENAGIDCKDIKEMVHCLDTIQAALEEKKKQEAFMDDHLTFKNGALMCGFNYKDKKIVAMPLEEYDKYGRLDNLEHALSIDLLVLFKALKNGVWVEVDPADINDDNPNTMYFEKFISLSKSLNGVLYLEVNDYVDELWLSDYKKTWWLKEDRSE